MKHFFATSYHILSGSLRPWLPENKDDEKFSSLNAKIRNHKDDHQTFFKELGKAYKSMNIEIEDEVLTEFKELQIILPDPDITRIHTSIDQPSLFDKKTEFYSSLLKNEYFAIINGIYNSIKTLAIDDAKYKLYHIFKKIEELTTLTTKVSDHSKSTLFIINLLKLRIFNIHTELNRIFLDLIDFEVLSQNELLYLIAPDFDNEKVKEQSISFILNNYLQKQIPVRKGKGTPQDKKLSFYYKQDSNKILENIYTHLTLKIDFINENLTSKDEFIKVMTSDNLLDLDIQVHIGCETTQFRYIIDKLNPYFKKLTLSNIEKSEIFYSKNGVLLKASNLSRNKQFEPKEKEYIDKVFKELQ